MVCTQYLGYSVREGLKPHVPSWNSTAAISLFEIRRVTHIKNPRSVQRKKIKKLYSFAIRYLAHVIHWYHTCIQRKELLLISGSIRFLEHETAFVWLQKCTFFTINNIILWTCSTINSVQKINSKNSSCHRYSVYNIYIVQY